MSDTEGLKFPLVSRREFFVAVGTAACAAAVIGAGAVFVEFLRPRVLFEPPTAFDAGPPDTFSVGSVVTNIEHRAYVMRFADGFRALSSVCTHLGCITRYQPDLKIIACPCHGSKYLLNGDVIAGPAPRPLHWLEMSLSQKGDIIVDTAIEVAQGTVYRF